MSNPLESMQELHAALTEVLLKEVKKSECPAAMLSVARQFLKDNNIDAIPVKGSALDRLADALPQFEEDPDAPQADVVPLRK